MRSLIDDLLAEQQHLTAVERFARRHEISEIPAQAQYYRDLIPLDRPRPGEQYAFAVDLDACTGCKACVSACHSLNGLDEDETWRSVGLLHGGTEVEPYQQFVTTACHHCVDPACLNGCPVLAYEKDEKTGIVRHLDDQCIGCQYCIFKCPYDVPKYSARRGIVRKCDMCHGRLAADEAPACVQACPSGAISIRLVAKADIERICAVASEGMIPGAFESSYSKPTTAYNSRKPIPTNARGAGFAAAPAEPAHWPLVWMLVLTQAAAGIFLWTWLISIFQPQVFAVSRITLSASGFALLVSGLAASIFHLGRPLGAWRAFLGLRRSWMSREIVVILALALAVGSTLAFPFSVLTTASAFLGVGGVFCSAMIYVDTRRPSWVASITFPTFFGAAYLLGSAATAFILSTLAVNGLAEMRSVERLAILSATAIRGGLYLWETRNRLPFPCSIKPLRRFNPVNFLLILSTLFGLIAIHSPARVATCFAFVSLALTTTAQLMKRYLFFTTATAPRMPGVGTQ